MRALRAFPGLALLGCCGALVSCSRPFPTPCAEHPAPQKQSPPPTAAAPAQIDDKALLATLTQAAGALIQNGKATPMGTLIGQLERSRCTLYVAEAARPTLPPHEIYRHHGASVLVVAGLYKCTKCTRWHTSTASGFLVSDSGAFVTSHHVAANKTRHTLVAMTRDGRAFAVKEVLAASAADDVAILQLDAAGERFAPLALRADAPVGTPVTVISHPSNHFYALTRGLISRYFRAERSGKSVPMMGITADFARGSSGAPVLDDSGTVVGMVRSTTSVYYTVAQGKKDNLQMVLKECVPAASILKLIEPSRP